VVGGEGEAGSEPHRARAPVDPVLNQTANTAVRSLTQEAGAFLGLAFASYAFQLALVASGKHVALPFWVLLVALLVSDFVTLIFALATMARFDLAGQIARVYNPWPSARAVVDQPSPDGQRAPGGGIAGWWFELEDALFRRATPSASGLGIRFVRRLAPYRQYPVLAIAVLVLALTNYLILVG
jgi:hypothetical protein